jgi:cell wall assembly regulator SMI1
VVKGLSDRKFVGYVEQSSMPNQKSQQLVSIKESWQRIERWLGDHAKSLAKSLSKGASAEQVQELEAHIGATLPAEFKQSLAIHDGQKEDCDFIPDDGIGSFYMLRIKDIPKEWKQWNKLLAMGEFKNAKATPDKGVANSWWNNAWIPFASNGGDFLCIDLAPTEAGIVGQIIKIRHDNPARKVMAASFGVWLEQLAETIENGGIDYFFD